MANIDGDDKFRYVTYRGDGTKETNQVGSSNGLSSKEHKIRRKGGGKRQGPLTPAQKIAVKAVRSVGACNTCKARKVVCDLNDPCHQCEKANRSSNPKWHGPCIREDTRAHHEESLSFSDSKASQSSGESSNVGESSEQLEAYYSGINTPKEKRYFKKPDTDIRGKDPWYPLCPDSNQDSSSGIESPAGEEYLESSEVLEVQAPILDYASTTTSYAESSVSSAATDRTETSIKHSLRFLLAEEPDDDIVAKRRRSLIVSDDNESQRFKALEPSDSVFTNSSSRSTHY